MTSKTLKRKRSHPPTNPKPGTAEALAKSLFRRVKPYGVPTKGK